MNTHEIQFFDPEQELTITERRLPHWTQPGVMCFITWRTNDSMPQQVLDSWYQERLEWLAKHGLRCTPGLESHLLEQLTAAKRREFNALFWNRWHERLDQGYGACVLSRSDVSGIVASSLQHFDGSRYIVTDFVVMPNHVHLLAAFADEQAMLKQCESWKHFTAKQINKLLGSHGRFWQQDGFDHLVRSEAQYQYLQKYIKENPIKANLTTGTYLHYSKTVHGKL